MEKLTTSLISNKILEKVQSGEIIFGMRKKITDFILTNFSYKECISNDGKNKFNVFCVCEYIEENSKYSKAFEITL